MSGSPVAASSAAICARRCARWRPLTAVRSDTPSSRKDAVVMGAGRPGNAEEVRRTSSGKSSVSRPRSRQTRYSSRTRVAIATTSAAVAAWWRGSPACSARRLPPENTSMTAISGTAGGWKMAAERCGPVPNT
jgi:hypothetical protein